MNTCVMDLQTRKLEFIREFLKLQNEEVLSRLEKLLKKEKQSDKVDDVDPMTIEELNKRIDKSLEDSKNGKLIEVNDLIAEIEKWG